MDTEQTMKAIRIHSFGGPEVLEYEDVPRPKPSNGQVLILLRAASVNPLERTIRQGVMQKVMPVKLPFIPGSDLAGVIESVGDDVAALSAGQEVYGFIPPTVGGTYAQYIAVPTDVLVAKHEALDFSSAASVPVVSMTAWQALFVYADLAEGQSVLIHGGAGGVGMYAVQFARWKGAHVTATASAKDIEFVKGLGADEVIDYKADRFEDKVSGVDVVLDVVGGETQQRSWQTIKPGGILVATTAPPSQEDAARHGVRTVMMQMQGDGEQLSTINELIAAGTVKTSVGATFPLAQAAEAQQASAKGGVRGKIVLQIE